MSSFTRDDIKLILEGLVDCISDEIRHRGLPATSKLLQVSVKLVVKGDNEPLHHLAATPCFGQPVVSHNCSILRKFASSCLPGFVRIDSGWNCTPSIVSSLWRTPMMMPDSERAVTSSTSGSVS